MASKLVTIPSNSMIPERDIDKSPILECINLGIQFGGLKAVDDFNLTIGRTEIAGLIGPNGAGKTTIFNLLTNPVEILTDDNGWVKGMVVRKMELGEPDASGRRRPVEVAGSDYTIDVDAVIMSLGTSPNPLISSTTEGLETNKWKCIIADESNGKTTKEGVYAGGDAVTGAATVILAMEAGRAGARGIDEYLNGNK